ncbi:tol-pal system-associated acyl-CoA thioesterase [Roseovarius sp. SYSU LYC5161]|uniref:tol-pal system-associated acyl-CoA thioesterase n=1 Tax=Roseovarius halophilus (ex Wu et al. 2025) TaxID=3376060 RepID=UPI003999AE68
MTHRFTVRVHYEDTDMGGIVYHANYLKFIERARSDWVRGLGLDQNAMRDAQGVVFAVRRVEADYHLPARYDDELEVLTETRTVSGARLVMSQQVLRDGALLFAAEVTIVCITLTGQPARLPANIRQMVH